MQCIYFLKILQGEGEISSELKNANESERKKSREILRTIINAILYLFTNSLSFRAFEGRS